MASLADNIQSKISFLQKEAEGIRQHAKKEEQRINQQISVLQKSLEQVVAGRDDFPPGFVFTYNDRRNDPQYTPYWLLSLEDKNGNTVWSQRYFEPSLEEQAALDWLSPDIKVKQEALDDAWRFVDIAYALTGHKTQD